MKLRTAPPPRPAPEPSAVAVPFSDAAISAVAKVLLRMWYEEKGIAPPRPAEPEPFEEDPQFAEEFVGRGAARHKAERRQTPPWANPAAIAEVYAQARRQTDATGIRHHVDHIYPLRGVSVCGLHVQSNLRVIPWFDNIAKGDKHEP